MSNELDDELGPLASWIGVWEGPKGLDVSPGPDRESLDTPYSERMTFEPLGAVDNHEQIMWGLRYRTEVTRLSDGNVFHEDMGYWLWDAERGQVMRAFVVPRGIAILAGGSTTADARAFSIEAVRGAATYGVSANQFLDENFRIERFHMDVIMESDGRLRYEEDTVMRMPGREALFHHTDTCVLSRVP